MATTYHFYLRKDKKNANGEAPVYLRITQNRKTRQISTGVRIPPRHWNAAKEKIRKSHKIHESLNQKLRQKRQEAQQVEVELSAYGSESARTITERLKNQQSGDFFDLATELTKELEQQKKLYDIKTLKVVLKKVEKFTGGRSLQLKHIDTEWLENFEHYLKTHYGNSSTTVNKNFQFVRKILRMALNKHLLFKNPFATFNGAKRNPAKPKVKLSIKQIKAMELLNLTKDSMEWHSRNAFLFSFYSAGIRFGDICCLKWSNIRDDRILYQMNKNNKTFSVALNKYQKEILSQYNGSTDEYIFPFLISHKEYDPVELRKAINVKNVTVNKNLKKITEKINQKIDNDELDIPKLDHVTFHVSRHTYAQYAVDSGLDVYEVMQTLRHSKIETTQKYLKSLNEELADKAMKKVF